MSIRIGRPRLPPLAALGAGLDGIWDRAWVTNGGEVHDELEARVAGRAGSPHLALTSSGTAALQLACAALGLRGEAITTPLTFPATVHALRWSGLRPVFCDIEPERLTLDPDAIEAAIGPQTATIVPVHLYGGAAHAAEIDEIARRHGLRVLYDAAHAFGVEIDGVPVARFGDASAFSFHATKVFHTLEGGAVAARDAAVDAAVRALRNHGFGPDGEIVGPGLNAKMNEVQALIGLHVLDELDEEIAARGAIAERYRERLDGVAGIDPLPAQPGVRQNHCYFAVMVDPVRAGVDATGLRDRLGRAGIETRRYFALSADAGDEPLPVARRAADRVLCLPIHGAMTPDDVEAVCDAVAAG